jgi:hypothetical protein
MTTKAAVRQQYAASLAVSGGLDPCQREHEHAILTLMIAASRYGASDEQLRDTSERLDALRHITALIAHEVVERVHHLRGMAAAAAFRKALGRRQP